MCGAEDVSAAAPGAWRGQVPTELGLRVAVKHPVRVLGAKPGLCDSGVLTPNSWPFSPVPDQQIWIELFSSYFLFSISTADFLLFGFDSMHCFFPDVQA